MSSLNAHLLRRSLAAEISPRLDKLDVFDSIASTNTYLLAQPPPVAGGIHAAITDYQTAGRGRHDRRWLSPPGSGLCLSLAYTFAAHPEKLPGLTLALGVGIVAAMQELNIHGIGLKWPNDIVALDGKLGGVLTEVQSQPGNGVTVVTGVGLNIDLPLQPDFGAESDWAHRAVDLRSITPDHPPREVLAGRLIGSLYAAMVKFEKQGFAGFVEDWRRHDWLHGRQIIVDLPNRQITGVAAGVDADGALLVDTDKGLERVISGSIVMAGLTEFRR